MKNKSPKEGTPSLRIVEKPPSKPDLTPRMQLDVAVCDDAGNFVGFRETSLSDLERTIYLASVGGILKRRKNKTDTKLFAEITKMLAIFTDPRNDGYSRAENTDQNYRLFMEVATEVLKDNSFTSEQILNFQSTVVTKRTAQVSKESMARMRRPRQKSPELK